MLGKILKVTGRVTLAVVGALLSPDDENDRNKKQLDMLNDGMGNVIADGEEMTMQEAKVAQARGELYDTYY
jgi:hypothetical protein